MRMAAQDIKLILQGRKIFFMGIGGIGMSALARHYLGLGALVKGYDRQATSLTRALEQEGALITYSADPGQFTADGGPESWLLVYTPAVPQDLPLWADFDPKIPRLKRAQVLGAWSHDHVCLAVAGTHGKTTTSTMLAYCLSSCGRDPLAFLGGISANFSSNYLPGKGREMVAEADEYDRSFLQLNPDAAIITAVDPDHLDIYGDAQTFARGFEEFAQQISPDGVLLRHVSTPDYRPKGVKVLTYGLAQGDYSISGASIRNGSWHFTWNGPDGLSQAVQLTTGGRHNLENALAAMSLARETGSSPEEVAQAMRGFKGVERRFQVLLKAPGATLVDDYAHHPTEISACLQGVRELWPQALITVVFQPHLYSRTRDFASGFSGSLSMADEVWLLPIYPAREKPIDGVHSGMLAREISVPVRELEKEQLVAEVARNKPELLVMLGAGDIDKLVPQVRQTMEGYA